MNVIDRFELGGEHGFLSNFYRHPITWQGVAADSAEHHFNAAKTTDPDERASVYAQPTPKKAKDFGRRVTLRPGWDERVRFQVMRSVLAAKFTDQGLRDRLLATGDALLIEGTTGWCDQTWGCCGCSRHRSWPGQNHLGRTLMALRSHLRGDPPNRWPRVAVTGHRPQDIPPESRAWVQDTLTTVAERLTRDHGTTVAISGFAIGADAAWAEAAIATGLDLWAYIPFEEQPTRWPQAEQATWNRHRNAAAREVVLGTTYDVRMLHARNDLLIRDADLIVAVHHPTKTTGGTASAIKKARAAGKPLLRLNLATQEVTLVPATTP